MFEVATTFARTEGIVPAPQSVHAVRAAIDEAARSRGTGGPATILFNLCGNGLLDLAAYDAHQAGMLRTAHSTMRPSLNYWRASDPDGSTTGRRDRRGRDCARGSGGRQAAGRRCCWVSVSTLRQWSARQMNEMVCRPRGVSRHRTLPSP
jgi:hypothetical protein